MIVHFDISRPKSVRAVEEAMLGDQKIFPDYTERPGYGSTGVCLMCIKLEQLRSSNRL